MTTEITTISDGLVARVAALLTSHTRLSNPYDLANNNDLVLTQGYGVALGSAAPTRRSMSCQVSVKRTFRISLTRRAPAIEGDAATRFSTERTLLEDLQTLIDDFEKNNALLTTGDYLVMYDRDTGIFPVRAGSNSYLAVTMDVTVEYQRNL